MANEQLTPAEAFYFEEDFMMNASVRARTRELHREMKDKTTADTYKREVGGKAEHYTELPDIPVEGLEAYIEDGVGYVAWDELAHSDDGNKLYQVNVVKDPNPDTDREYQVVNMSFPKTRRVVVEIRNNEPLQFKTIDYDLNEDTLHDPAETLSDDELEDLYEAGQ